MNNTFVITVLSFAFLTSCQHNSPHNSISKKPNIVILVTDDAGYSDYSLFGSQIETPNIDALARNGFVFTNFYNNGRCSPTRASLLTGQYPHKVGVGELARPSSETSLKGYLGYLNPAFATMSEILAPLGYFNVMAGKWHLGGQLTSRANESIKWPIQRGFDSFFGILGGTVRTHFKPSLRDHYYYNNEQMPPALFNDDFFSTDAIMDHVIEEMTNVSDKPLFLYVPFFAPHLPLEAPQHLVDKYTEVFSNYPDLRDLKNLRLKTMKTHRLISDQVKVNTLKFHHFDKMSVSDKINSFATHAAMMENIDTNIGRLITSLKENGTYENTMIVLLSDNGVSANGVCDIFNAPYYGRKGMLWEGGIKTPLIFSWPAKFKGEMKVIEKGYHVMDILPTILDIIGEDSNLKSYAGRSFKDYIHGDIKADDKYYLDREFLFWSDRMQSAGINKDGFKWINTDDQENLLFNLLEDPTERIDIASSHTELIKEFRKEFIKHKASNNIEAFEVVESSRLN